MKKQFVLLLAGLAISFSFVMAQNESGNPFKHLGYEVGVYTLTDYNEEFHDFEDVVEIGQVLYDTRNKKIVGFVGEKDHRIELVKDVISTSIDPHCEKYPWISPYAYCLNNPVKFIDPDGRDVWEINRNGEIVKRIEDKTQDAFFMVDNDGNRTYNTDKDGNKTYHSISFDYETIGNVTTEKIRTIDKDGNINDNAPITLFSVKGDDNATQLFEFFASPVNTKIEWTHAKIGTENSGRNIIGTSHEKSSTAVGQYLNNRSYTLREVNHNHPSGDTTTSPGDRVGAVNYHMRNPNTKLNIYTHPQKYTSYTRFGTILGL